MIPALRHLQRLRLPTARHAIHQPVLLIDPPRPPARQIAAERLGLAGALERMAAAFLDQGVQLVDDLRVMLLPMAVIVPRRRPERHVHG